MSFLQLAIQYITPEFRPNELRSFMINCVMKTGALDYAALLSYVGEHNKANVDAVALEIMRAVTSQYVPATFLIMELFSRVSPNITLPDEEGHTVIYRAFKTRNQYIFLTLMGWLERGYPEAKLPPNELYFFIENLLIELVANDLSGQKSCIVDLRALMLALLKHFDHHLKLQEIVQFKFSRNVNRGENRNSRANGISQRALARGNSIFEQTSPVSMARMSEAIFREEFRSLTPSMLTFSLAVALADIEWLSWLIKEYKDSQDYVKRFQERLSSSVTEISQAELLESVKTIGVNQYNAQSLGQITEMLDRHGWTWDAVEFNAECERVVLLFQPVDKIRFNQVSAEFIDNILIGEAGQLKTLEFNEILISEALLETVDEVISVPEKIVFSQCQFDTDKSHNKFIALMKKWLQDSESPKVIHYNEFVVKSVFLQHSVVSEFSKESICNYESIPKYLQQLEPLATALPEIFAEHLQQVDSLLAELIVNASNDTTEGSVNVDKEAVIRVLKSLSEERREKVKLTLCTKLALAYAEHTMLCDRFFGTISNGNINATSEGEAAQILATAIRQTQSASFFKQENGSEDRSDASLEPQVTINCCTII